MKIKIESLKKYAVFVIFIVIGVLFMVLPGDEKIQIKQTSPDTAIVLENRIAELIKKTYNIEEVSVILTYDTYGEKIVNDTKGETNSYFGSDDEPFVKSEKLPYVRGALIAAKNIDEKTSEKIRDAVSILLGIATHKVTVIYN